MEDIIRINNLAKEFNGLKVLKGISFSVNKGAVFGLLGPNGSGKTTTIRIILNILKPTSGKVEVLGVDVTAGEYDNTRRSIGCMLENLGLIYYLNGEKNLAFFDRIYNDRSSEAERERRIKDLLNFVGLWESRDKPISAYSQGMMRRLALARALINDPELLILDEPTLGLDPEARKVFRDMIFELKDEGKTIFLSSHDLDEVQRICSKIALIKDGEVMGCGSYEELNNNFGTSAIVVRVNEVGAWTGELKSIVKDLSVDGNNLTMLCDDLSMLYAFFAQKKVKVLEMRNVSNMEDIYLKMVNSEPERRLELINAMKDGRRRV